MPKLEDIKLGLNLPTSLPVGQFRDFRATFGEWSIEAIANALAERPRAKDKYPAKDWIKNQNPYGSCCSHAYVNVVEREYFDRTGVRIILQPHQLYAQINGGADQGATLVAGAKATQSGGIPLLSDAPDANKIYASQYGGAEMQRLATRSVKGKELFEVRTKESLLTALAMGFKCVVAVHVDQAYVDTKHGVTPVNNGPGNHAICIDDAWRDPMTRDFLFDNPGSWGLSLGDEDARWKFSWNNFATTTNYHVFYAIPEVTDLPTLVKPYVPPIGTVDNPASAE